MARVAFVLNPALKQRRHSVGPWRETPLNGKTYHALNGRVYDLENAKDRADYNDQLAKLVNDPFVRNAAISGAFTLVLEEQGPAFDVLAAKPATTLAEVFAMLPHLIDATETVEFIGHINGRLAKTQDAYRNALAAAAVPVVPVPTPEPQPVSALEPVAETVPAAIAEPETITDNEPDELGDNPEPETAAVEPAPEPVAEPVVEVAPEPVVEDPPSGDLPPVAAPAAAPEPKKSHKKKK